MDRTVLQVSVIDSWSNFSVCVCVFIDAEKQGLNNSKLIMNSECIVKIVPCLFWKTDRCLCYMSENGELNWCNVFLL